MVRTILENPERVALLKIMLDESDYMTFRDLKAALFRVGLQLTDNILIEMLSRLCAQKRVVAKIFREKSGNKRYYCITKKGCELAKTVAAPYEKIFGKSVGV